MLRSIGRERFMSRPMSRALRAAGFGLLLLLASPAAAVAGSDALRGEVTRVRDGDTIEIGEVAVRLQGVAAPELRDPLGREAGEAMRRLVLGRVVECVPDGSRSYDRIVAVCFLDGLDIAAWLIGRGLARDCPRYSKGRYRDIEAAAATHTAILTLYPLPRYCKARGRRVAGNLGAGANNET